MLSPSAKMVSTLRLFTRAGREPTFSTTLVEDGFTRPLRSLVDGGFLSMEYTGSRRIYTLTDQGRTYLEGKIMGKKKRPPTDAPRHAVTPPVKNGHSSPQTKSTLEPPPRRKKPRSDGLLVAPPRVPTGKPLSPVEVIRLMREVRDYADAHEGVDDLLAMIQRVEEIAQRFGGLDCVRESLQAIREFRQEK